VNAPRELVDVGALDRGSYIGGGDIAALIGVSPWRTPLDVYLSKTGQAVPWKPDPAREKRLRRGQRMEPYIVDMLVEDYGITIDARGHRYVDPKYPFIATEIDFEWHDADDPRIRNGEIKTTAIMPGQHNPWGEEGTDEIPIYYAAQSMLGLGVTGRDVCQYGVLFGMDNLVLYALERDDETIAQLRETARAFWMDHVIPRIPPAPKTLGDLAKLWPVERRGKIEATPEIEAALAEHRALGTTVRVAEEGREDFEFKIKEFCGDHAEIITRNGVTIATFKAQTRTSIDQKALKADKPDVFDQFARSTQFRVLRHKVKE
jgi:predicted phage-related endonuclease